MGETMFPPWAPFFSALQVDALFASRRAKPGSGVVARADPAGSEAWGKPCFPHGPPSSSRYRSTRWLPPAGQSPAPAPSRGRTLQVVSISCATRDTTEPLGRPARARWPLGLVASHARAAGLGRAREVHG